jgi:hypothetical protein
MLKIGFAFFDIMFCFARLLFSFILTRRNCLKSKTFVFQVISFFKIVHWKGEKKTGRSGCVCVWCVCGMTWKIVIKTKYLRYLKGRGAKSILRVLIVVEWVDERQGLSRRRRLLAVTAFIQWISLRIVFESISPLHLENKWIDDNLKKIYVLLYTYIGIR